MKYTKLLSQFFMMSPLCCLTNVQISENIICNGSYDKKVLECETFTIYGSCDTNEAIANKGAVYGSMFVKNLLIYQSLIIYGSLYSSEKICCSQLTTYGDVLAKNLELQKSIIKGSTLISGTVHAKNSEFSTLSISDKCPSTKAENAHITNNNGVIIVNTGGAVHYNDFFGLQRLSAWLYSSSKKIASDSEVNEIDVVEIKEEKSDFENCTLGSITIEKSKNTKQIIELTNTTVTGDIEFKPGTQGEVWLNNAQVHGNIINGIVKNI